MPESSVRGHRFEGRELIVFEPVIRENTRLGTICVKADLRFFYQRLGVYAGIAVMITLGSIAIALVCPFVGRR